MLKLAVRRRSVALGTAGVISFLVFFELLPYMGIVNKDYFPPTHTIIGAILTLFAEPVFWVNLWTTVWGLLLGLTLASLLGVVLGIAIGSSQFLQRLTFTTVEFLRPIPSVALIPLVVLLLGTTTSSTLVLVVVASFWPMFIQVLYGVRDVDPVAQDVAHSYRFSRITTIRSVVWPGALPFVMTGFRLSAMYALIMEVTGELAIGSPGLGNMLLLAQSGNAVARMYALIAITGLLGLFINAITRAIERHLLRWHQSVRRTV